MGNDMTVGRVVRAVATLGVSEMVRTAREFDANRARSRAVAPYTDGGEIVPSAGGGQSLSVQQSTHQVTEQEDRHEEHHVVVSTVKTKYSQTDHTQVSRK